MLSYIKVSRPINLIIVGLTQFIVYYFLFIQTPQSKELVLYPNLLVPFILVTIIITACGYYINDYFDYATDKINNKKNRLSEQSHYLLLYFSFFIIGFLLAYWIAAQIGQPALCLIYILANILLFMYSSSFKKKPLIGNVIVALFSCFVILILFYAEYGNIYLNNLALTHERLHVSILIKFYIVFIFLISLIREIIKDMEDIEGDNQEGHRTLPIVIGIKKTKQLITILSFFLIGALVFWYTKSVDQHNLALMLCFFIGLILPLINLAIGTWRSNKKESFRQMSNLSKGIMLLGLAYLILYIWI